MKKFLSNYLFFLSVFIIAFIIIELIFKNSTPSNDRYKWQYEELFSPKVEAEIVIFGSSKAVRGINPKVFENDNLSAYNFGLNGSNPEFLYHWYEKLFKKNYPKPKVVIFEVSWLMFDENTMWRRLEQDSKYFPLKTFLNEMLDGSSNKSTLFFNRFYMFNQSIGKGGMIDSTYNGFTPFNNSNVNIKPRSKSINFLPEKQRRYFERILESFNKDSINVVFVTLPEKIEEKSLNKTVLNNLKYIEEKLSRFNFLNYQNEFKNDSLFKDRAHLNIKGANIISEKLKRDLKSIININYK